MKRRTFLAQGAGVGLAAVVSPAAIGATAASPLIVGQSAALTGPQSGFGIAIRDGLEAALASINRNGDVYGRPVQLVSLDDQGDKAKTESNVAQLAANPRVVGLTGFTTRPCSEAGAVLAAKEGIALVGAFSGTPLLYGEKAATTFTTRASYERELDAIVRHYRFLGMQRFGFVHLEDARSSRAAFIEGMSRVGSLDLGYTNLRFRKSERSGSRFVDLSLASRNAGLV